MQAKAMEMDKKVNACFHLYPTVQMAQKEELHICNFSQDQYLFYQV